jgi:type IV secretory pathway VirD2 relaxase
MARFVDRSEELHPALEIRQDARRRFIGRSIVRHRLPGTLRQLEARGVYVPMPPPASRQAVVKIWPASPKTTAAHLRYLEHGKGVDGQDAVLFTDSARTLNRDAVIMAAQDDRHQHRFMFSVVDGDRLNLPRFTEDVMRQVEKDVDARLDWVAAVHQDTSHRHVHVLIRGRDGTGEPVYFKKHYWTQGLRYRVMELATEYLGPQRTPTVDKTLDRFMTEHMWEARQSRRLTPVQVRVRMREAEEKIAAMRARAQRRLASHTQRRGVDVSD